MMNVKLRCEELREAELKMEVSICGPKQGEILGEEINEEDLMNVQNNLNMCWREKQMRL